MNKHVNYITSAHFILAVAFGAMFIINKIPPTLIEEEEKRGFCGTVMPPEKILDETQLEGKNLFEAKCASCHKIGQEMTGPDLQRFQDRGPWADRNKLYEWIRNPKKMMETDPYTRELKKKYNVMMDAFPSLTNEEIDAIAAYVN